MTTNIYKNIWPYTAQFFLEWKNFSHKSCEENEDTHFKFNNIFFSGRMEEIA